MGCEAADRVVGRWQRGEDVPLEEARLAAGHVAACRRCHSRYAAAVPLLLRDAGDNPVGHAELPPGLEDAIMGRLAARPAGRRPSRQPRLRTILAIAASLLLVLGAAAGLFIRLRPASGGQYLTVTFVLDAPQARSVAVVGDFTNWQSMGYELVRRGGGEKWTITLHLRRDRTYTYCFLVDEQEWVLDPNAPETVVDGFGGIDSVLRL